MLLRCGPDLLRVTSLDNNPRCVETDDRDAPPQSADELSSRDGDAHLEQWEPAELLLARPLDER
jgi:hypothetical protein